MPKPSRSLSNQLDTDVLALGGRFATRMLDNLPPVAHVFEEDAADRAEPRGQERETADSRASVLDL